jgi:hypothetical protein
MTGLIAFFDILGYQSFLENNSASESALEVLDLITRIPAEPMATTAKAWKRLHTEYPGSVAASVEASLKHLIFSDTIVLSLPYPDPSVESWQVKSLTYLSSIAAMLSAAMFVKGLPLRGAIVEGDFVAKDMCLAGQAVVEAYRLCESLDFSGVVISPGVMGGAVLSTAVGADVAVLMPTADKVLLPYLSPLNGGSEKRLVHVNWLALLDEVQMKDCLSDIDSFVLRSFWAHKKDCPLSVDKKIHNTQKLVRRLAIALDDAGA